MYKNANLQSRFLSFLFFHLLLNIIDNIFSFAFNLLKLVFNAYNLSGKIPHLSEYNNKGNHDKYNKYNHTILHCSHTVSRQQSK